MTESMVKARVELLDCECGFISIDLRTWKYPYSDKDYYEGQAEMPGGPDNASILHRVEQLRRHLKGGLVGDLGSGNGLLPLALARGGYHAVGVEESFAMVAWLRERFPEVEWQQRDILEYLSARRQHDGITMYHVLEHIPAPRNVVRLLADSIRNGGVLVVEVPDVSGGRARILGGKWGGYMEHHVNYFSLQTLTALLVPYGFELLECERKYHMATPGTTMWRNAVHGLLLKIGINDIIATVWKRV
jgi:SAM-dependent methyltransferase